MALSVDEVFDHIGSFGKYQKLLLLGCSILVFFWFGFPVLIMTFLTADPGWKCVHNSSVCRFTDSMPRGGGTPLQEANGDVPLDGVAFSRLE